MFNFSDDEDAEGKEGEYNGTENKGLPDWGKSIIGTIGAFAETETTLEKGVGKGINA